MMVFAKPGEGKRGGSGTRGRFALHTTAVSTIPGASIVPVRGHLLIPKYHTHLLPQALQDPHEFVISILLLVPSVCL